MKNKKWKKTDLFNKEMKLFNLFNLVLGNEN